MLDISIKNLDKVKAWDMLKFQGLNAKITEKIDGTKLTLIRNDVDFDSHDYTKNWIVAYKGNIISPDEFDSAPSDDIIKKHSLGCLQYALVHRWLQKCHAETSYFPKSTEFLLEFVQRKPTLTRDYDRKFDLFLIGLQRVECFVHGSTLVTFPNEDMNRDRSYLTQFAIPMEISLPPLLYTGPWAKRPNFNDLKSILGGPAEGIIIDFGGKEIFKAQRSDQLSKEVRALQKRVMLGRTLEQDEEHWREVYVWAVDHVNSAQRNNSLSKRMQMKALSVFAFKTITPETSEHNFRFSEDVFLTSKLILQRRHAVNFELFDSSDSWIPETVAFIPMAAKPLHVGHERLIQIAIQNFNRVICMVSKGDRDRISGQKMMQIWRDYILPSNFIPSVVFSDSPVRDMIRFIRGLSDDPMFKQVNFNIVTDDSDDMWKPEDLEREFPELHEQARIHSVGVSRETTAQISGSKMRYWLTIGNRAEFLAHLPSFLSTEHRHKIWEILSK